MTYIRDLYEAQATPEFKARFGERDERRLDVPPGDPAP